MKVWVERRDGVSHPLGCKRWAHVVGLWPSVASPGPACRQLGRGVEPGVEKLLLGLSGLGTAGTTTMRWGLGGTRCCHSDLVFLARSLLPGLSSASNVPPPHQVPAACLSPKGICETRAKKGASPGGGGSARTERTIEAEINCAARFSSCPPTHRGCIMHDQGK